MTDLRPYRFSDEQWHEIQVLGLIPDVDSLALRHGEIVRPSGGAAPVAERVAVSPDDVMRLMDQGVFEDGQRVELLDGRLWEKMGQGTKHYWAIWWFARALQEVEAAGYTVLSQAPVTFPRSLPEPDVVLLRGAPSETAGVTASSGLMALAVEVADSSLHRDLGLKMREYALAEVPEYWVLDLQARVLWIHRQPHGGGYREAAPHREDATVSVLGAPHVPLRLLELWEIVDRA
jgi:Uma2 family endonuclease